MSHFCGGEKRGRPLLIDLQRDCKSTLSAEESDMNSSDSSTGANWMTGASNNLLLFLSTALCLVVASIVFFSRRRFQALEDEASQARASRAKDRAKRADNPFSSPGEGKKNDNEQMDKNDVWKDRRKKGVVPSSSSSSKAEASTGDKPFHSSYYYAHNSSNSKGGYSDGLAMEDYVMNKPRLLARGGKPVIEEVVDDAQDETPERSTIDEVNASTKEKTSAAKDTGLSARTTVLKITKYSWDDAGDSKGVASIRIDSLPSATGSSSDQIPWSEANVTETSAELVNGSKGLFVVVKTDKDVEYQLEMTELYGQVTSVKAINKSKRLIVKIQKTTGFLYRKNLEAWPLPMKKV